MALTKLPTAAFSEGSMENFRNLIINGDMSIAQRGTSATGLGNGDAGYHTLDRWRFNESGAATGEFTMSQDTDVPTGQGFAKSLKMDCTTADTGIAADESFGIQQRFEGQNLQQLKKGTSNAESLTLSFWVKSNKTGDYSTVLYDSDNVRIIGSTYTINSANTWEKKTITFAGDTTGSLTNDANYSFMVFFALVAGSNYTSSDNTSWSGYTDAKFSYGHTVNMLDNTANEWYITGVQLEVGTSASDFEFLPYDVNLRRCQRYYWKETSSPNAGGQWTAVGGVSQTNVGRVMMFLPTSMRSIPTSLGTNGTASDYRIQYRNTGEVCNAVPSFVTANYDKIQFNLSTAASMVVGEYCALRYASANTGYLEVDVEL